MMVYLSGDTAQYMQHMNHGNPFQPGQQPPRAAHPHQLPPGTQGDGGAQGLGGATAGGGAGGEAPQGITIDLAQLAAATGGRMGPDGKLQGMGIAPMHQQVLPPAYIRLGE